MRAFLVLAMLALFGTVSEAEVIRCADAAGNVSYTDGACPSGARQMGRVTIPPPARASGDDASRYEQDLDARRPMPSLRDSDVARPSQAVPAGPAIIDSRGDTQNDRAGASRWSDRGGDDPVVVDYGYGYPGAYRQPAPPRDMRPRIRKCDARGCQDTQGNQYDRSGQLDRYQSIDGKTCRPVGTTTICR